MSCGTGGRDLVGSVDSEAVRADMGSFVESVRAQVWRCCAMGEGMSKG